MFKMKSGPSSQEYGYVSCYYKIVDIIVETVTELV